MESTGTLARQGPYRHHQTELKRAAVEETLRPGASVASIAREHGIDANPVFHWRKLYREGLLGDAASAMLPVTIDQEATGDRLDGVQAPGS